MTTAPARDRWSSVHRLLDPLPRDLVAVVVAALGGGAIALATGSDGGVLRALAGFVFVLVLPGYALVATLFPGPPTRAVVEPARSEGYSPATGERLALSVGCSLALLPLLALGHALLGVPFETATVVTSVAATTVGLATVAAGRRLLRPPAARYRPPSLRAATADLRSWVSRDERVDTALTVLLVVGVVLALAGVAYGVAGPGGGQGATSVALLTTADDGSLVASNYPTNYSEGEPRELTLRLANGHDRAVEYAVVGELQRVERTGPGNVTVSERERVATATAAVPANDTWHYRHEVAPATTGEGLRLIYYVYRGSVPEEPSAESAARTTHLWVTVRPAGG